MRALAVVALAVAFLAVASGARVPGAPGCPVFPATNPWNERVDRLPVAARSTEIVAHDRRRRDAPRRLRLRALGGIADRHPDHGRPRLPEARTRLVPLRGRVGSRAVSHPRERPHRRRLRPPRRDRRPRRLPPVRALRPRALRIALEGRLRRDLGSPLEPPPARGLDVGGRRGAADPSRPRALRRGRRRPHRPRPPLHGLEDAACVRLSRTPLRERRDRSVAPADGPAAPPEGRLSDLAASRARRASSSRRSSATG